MLIQKSKPKQHRPQNYHGHTIIELRNARTGIRDRVESDNEFTDGISHYLQSGGWWNLSPWFNSAWQEQDIWRNLIGGILLFDKTIEKVDGAYPTTMPAGTKMIANGAYGVVNNGNPTEMMSFNANESLFNANALTFVYDATTSQGNGRIEAVSLTSETGGYIGYGNSVSQVAHATKKSLFTNQSTRIFRYGSSMNNVMIDEDYIGIIDGVSDGAVNFRVRNQPLKNASLFDQYISKTAELPSAFSGKTVSAVIADGLKIAVIENFTAKTNTPSTFLLGIYDVLAESWTTYTVSLPSTVQAYSNTSILFFPGGFRLHQNASGNYPALALIYKYDDTSDYVDATSTLGAGGTEFVNISPGLHFNLNGLIYDEENDTLYPTNGSGLSAYMRGSYLDNDLLAVHQYYYGNGDNYVYKNPLYLATINNLDNTVVKTTSDTMKVIYTVTPA